MATTLRTSMPDVDSRLSKKKLKSSIAAPKIEYIAPHEIST